jgi:hypothetical protein
MHTEIRVNWHEDELALPLLSFIASFEISVTLWEIGNIQSMPVIIDPFSECPGH